MDSKLSVDKSNPLDFVLTTRMSNDSMSARAREIMQATCTIGTRKAYEVEWRRFVRWSKRVGIEEYPVSSHTLGAYLVWMFDSKYSKSTIKKTITVLSLVHDDTDDPTGDKVIRQMLKGICRMDRRVPKKAPALGLNELIAMCTRLKARGSKADIRNAAIISLGWMAALRSSELVSLHWSDISQVSEGFEITIRESKTNKGKDPELIAIPFLSPDYDVVCPVRNLLAILSPVEQYCIGHLDVPVFHRSGSAKALSPRTVDRILRSAADLAGINRRYTSHSMRRGWATYVMDHGITERDFMRHGRWKSSQVAQGYVERSDMWRKNPIVTLFV